MPDQTKLTGAVNRRQILQLAALAGVAGTGLLGAREAYAAGALRMLSEDTADVEIAWYKALVEEFVKANPGVNVQYDYANVTEIFNKVTTALAANDPPDLLTGDGLAKAASLGALGVLEPADDLVDKIGRDDFSPTIISQFTIDGKMFAVPQQASPFVLWYRKDLAEKAGVKAPGNWDELLAFAKATNKDGVSGIVYPAGINSAAARQLFIFLRQNGGNVVDEDLNPALDTPANKQTLEYLKQLYQYSPAGSANYNYAEMLNLFVTGKAASSYYTGRMLARANTVDPNIYANMGAVREPANTNPFTYSEPRGVCIFAGAKNKDFARKWVLDFQLEPAHLISWLLTSAGAQLPLQKSIASDPRFTEFPIVKENKEVFALMAEEAGTGGNFYLESPKHKPNPKSGALDTGPILPTLLQRFLINGESAESALAWGQGQLKDLMSDI